MEMERKQIAFYFGINNRASWFQFLGAQDTIIFLVFIIISRAVIEGRRKTAYEYFPLQNSMELGNESVPQRFSFVVGKDGDRCYDYRLHFPQFHKIK